MRGTEAGPSKVLAWLTFFLSLACLGHNYASAEVVGRSGNPRTIHVRQAPLDTGEVASGRMTATNLQAAVDAAEDGDTVLVGAGVYRTSVPVEVRTGIILRGEEGASATRIRGMGCAPCLVIRHPQAVVEGLTITGDAAGKAGGGVLADGGGVVRDCVIVSNACDGAQSRGGGIVLLNGSRAENCRILANKAGNGGGAFVGSGSVLSNCWIIGNCADRSGGGVMVVADGVVIGCEVSTNAAAEGGGVAVYEGAQVRSCSILGNRARSHGGGVYCSGKRETAVRECIIAGNRREGGHGCGGGMALNGPGSRVENCLVARNKDDRYGGGVSFYGGGSGPGGTMVHCTVVENHGGYGTAVYAAGGQGILVNCIVAGGEQWELGQKSGALVYGEGLSFTNCWLPTALQAALQAARSLDPRRMPPSWRNQLQGTRIVGTENVFSPSPGFLNGPLGEYGLGPDSVCIDRGLLVPGVTRDLAGRPRSLPGRPGVPPRPDIGAFEAVASVSPR